MPNWKVRFGMKPCRLPSFALKRKRHFRCLLVFFTALAAPTLVPISAQLITAEVSGPVNIVAGHPEALGAGVGIGATLRFTFSYDSVMTPIASSSASAYYLATGPGNEATVDIGEFHYAVPDVSLSIVSGSFFGSSVFNGRVDSFNLRALTYTGVKDTEIVATLLYPLGTFTSHVPQIPPSNPFYAQLYVQRIYPHNPNLGAHLQSLYFNGYPPPYVVSPTLIPLPESNLVAWTSVLVLAAATVMKLRRSRHLVRV
jgi:hypothetical protein